MTTDFSYTNISHQPLLKPLALAALWRNRAAKELRHWQQWLEKQGVLDESSSQALNSAQGELLKAQYKVAVVGEVSQGKSELINAMLFAQYGQRILPTGVGHGVICPVEFFSDEDLPPFLEFLSIDTRAGAATLQQLLDTPSAWQRIDLSGKSIEEIKQTFLKVCDTKKITHEQAQQLGFENLAPLPSKNAAKSNVAVAQWRYARMNLQHPLLATGLAVLDTSGLNSLGPETQLTIEALALVEAAVYMLSVNAGVTRSDQLAWEEHLSHLPTESKMVVLNKIDSLNDGIRSPLEIRSDILQQIEKSALALHLPKNQIFAVAARSGLLARFTKNDTLLEQSRLSYLEKSLATHLIENRQDLLKKDAFDALETSFRACARDIKGLKLQSQTQLTELESLSSAKNPEQAIEAYASDTQKRHLQAIALSQTIEQAMSVHRVTLLELLTYEKAHKSFEAAIYACKNESVKVIRNQLQVSISMLHSSVNLAVQESNKTIATSMRALIKVNKLNGVVEVPNVPLLDPMPQAVDLTAVLEDLDRLAQSSSTFLPSMLLIGNAPRAKAAQSILSLQIRCGQIMADASAHCEAWMTRLLEPISHAQNLTQTLLLKRDDTLVRMQQAQQALSKNLDALRKEINLFDSRLKLMKQRCEQTAYAIVSDINAVKK